MSPIEVAVVDYGVGNLLSVQRGLEQCGAKVTVSADHRAILSASHVVLPGVGAFGGAMRDLEGFGLVDVIKEVARRGTPLLGICLGMQLLLEESEEFEITGGLALIDGRVVPVPSRDVSGLRQKIPYIGWNPVVPARVNGAWDGTILETVCPGEAFYFVHSFAAEPTDPAHCLAVSVHGGHRIAAVVGRDNVVGCQFHPEKSGESGLKILRQFVGQ